MASSLISREVNTPLGAMLAVASIDSLCLLEFSDRRMLPTQLQRVRKRFAAEIASGASPIFDRLQTQLDQYFAGQRQSFDLPLRLPGTPFQELVWRELGNIAYGHTRSYQQMAQAVGRPEAVRAVGKANGDNRMAIIVPCHRVVGADGKLVGYGGKLWRKRYLLELEAK